MLQSIVFTRQLYNPSMAKKWLNQYGFKPIKGVHATNTQLRYRIKPPVINGVYHSRYVDNGVLFVFVD